MKTASGSMFRVSGSLVRASKFTLSVALVLVLVSCGEKQNDTTSTQQKTTDSRQAIGTTGYTIQLLPGYTIEPDTVFDAWYFKPVTPDMNESEAGIYIGAHPDTAAPPIAYTKTTLRDVFMGDSVTWVEYKTEKYTQRETFVDLGPDKKIHSWCYSRDPSGIESLFGMIKTIR